MLRLRLGTILLFTTATRNLEPVIVTTFPASLRPEPLLLYNLQLTLVSHPGQFRLIYTGLFLRHEDTNSGTPV